MFFLIRNQVFNNPFGVIDEIVFINLWLIAVYLFFAFNFVF